MLAYYGTRLSEHMTKTPEGFLICRDVPIARTGRQDYLPQEIGQEGDHMVPVYRTEDEVFSTATIASFEGKAVTNDHPPTSVTADNYGMYLKGHCQNVHRGKGENSDLLYADLIINDSELIREIENGLREVSCGYECDYCPDERGNVYQRRIRGNHVAVVAAGRAGNRVAIQDSKPDTNKGGKPKMPKKETSMLAKFFSGWAADREPEEVAEAVDELIETGAMPEEQEDADPMTDPMAPAPAAPATTDGDNTEVINLLKQILAKVGGNGMDADPAAEPDAGLTNLVDELGGDPNAEQVPPMDADPIEQEASVTVPAEEIDADPMADPIADPTMQDRACDSASTIAAIKALRPYIAKLPARDRRAASDAAVRAVRKARGLSGKATSDGVAAMIRAQRMQAAARNSKAKVDESTYGKDIMAKYNPHYKK